MHKLIIIAIALCLFGCSTVGEYAGMDLSIGYGHKFSDDTYSGDAFGISHKGFGYSSFSGKTEDSDYIGVGATILLRPTDD